jgi:hypothetical protein
MTKEEHKQVMVELYEQQKRDKKKEAARVVWGIIIVIIGLTGVVLLNNYVNFQS